MANRLQIEDKLDTMNDTLRKISFAIGGEVAKPTTWEEIRILCRNNKIKGSLEVGETVEFEKDEEKYNAVVMDFIEGGQHSAGLKLRNGLQTGVIFQMEKIFANMQFDAREAFYYAENGLSAGTYNFSFTHQTWFAGDVGKTFQFTLNSAVPAGGQLVFSHSPSATITGSTIDVFASADASTGTKTGTVSEGSAGISLGTIKNSIEGNFNSCQRAFYGNNRYKESALRQFLNSNGEVGAVWVPQNKWDRQPSWRASAKGFLNGLQKDLLDNIAKVDRCVYRNTLSDGSGLDEITETIFLPSRNEVFMPTEGADNTEPFAFYKDNSISAVPHTDADECRIKNQKNGSAYHWWLESPYAGSTRNVRSVTPTGAVDSSNATNSYGVVPAFVIA